MEGFPGLTLRHRGRTGLTQRELAARVGVHQRSIQDWEAGLSHPSAQRLRALITVFLGAGAFLEGLESAEAQALWSAAQAEAPRLKAPFEADWFAGLLARRPGASADEQMVRGPRRQHWGEAPDVAAFLGRVQERELLRRWVLDERCRVVAILGLGGVGKTLLATRLALDLAPAFDHVYWRSLRNAPAPGEWLDNAIGFLSPDEARPEGEAAQLERLLDLVRQTACLLVLDNFETVLQPGPRAGDGGGGQDGSVTLWDAPRGRLLAKLRGHAAIVYGLALSRDGRLLAGGSDDGLIKLWDAPSGHLLATLPGHSAGFAA